MGFFILTVIANRRFCLPDWRFASNGQADFFLMKWGYLTY
jgi:hypothetical protein